MGLESVLRVSSLGFHPGRFGRLCRCALSGWRKSTRVPDTTLLVDAYGRHARAIVRSKQAAQEHEPKYAFGGVTLCHAVDGGSPNWPRSPFECWPNCLEEGSGRCRYVRGPCLYLSLLERRVRK